MQLTRRGFLGTVLALAGATAMTPKVEAAAPLQTQAFPHSSGHGMREIGLKDRPIRSPMDLRIMCWDCEWVSPWMHESVSVVGVFAPFETHLAAVHPDEAIDHEMQWRPSQWQWPEYLESVDEQVAALTPKVTLEGGSLTVTGRGSGYTSPPKYRTTFSSGYGDHW